MLPNLETTECGTQIHSFLSVYPHQVPDSKIFFIFQNDCETQVIDSSERTHARLCNKTSAPMVPLSSRKAIQWTFVELACYCTQYFGCFIGYM